MAQLPDHISGSDAHAGLSLLQDVKARFATNPAVYQEFFGLLAPFRNGKGEVADVRAVVDRAYALLQGHPDLVRRFAAFNPFLCRPDQHEAEPAREDPPTRPKRERRRLPVVVDADCAGPMQFLERKRERRRPAVVEADCAGSMQFLERVKLAGAGVYDRFLALLIHVHAEEALDANEIYKKAREVFGSRDSNLLRGFTEYLPTGRDFLGRRTMKEPLEEHRAPAAKRKAPAAAAPANPVVVVGGGGKKKPRIDERKMTNRRASALVAGTSKRDKFSEFRKAWEFETTYSKLAVTMRRTKKALEEEPPGHHGRPRKFEELYPARECQGVLREMYGDIFVAMQEALEDGVRTELALKTILRRLRKLEQVAVKMAMERRDPARVKAWVYKCVVDRVGDLKKEQKERGHAIVVAREHLRPACGMM